MRKRLKLIAPVVILVFLAGAFFAYTGNYYHADDAALAAMASDDTVAVIETDYGWLFDGPSDDTALIFYPGAKVEAEAYAPMLRLLASGGMEVCLVKMPFRLAFFGMNKAESVMREHSYSRWFIGGHSLGGAMAASCAADHAEELTGVILFAAYPTKTLDERLVEISLYGSEDGVLNMERMAAGRAYAPEEFYEYVIEGGNHAQFGNYGEQKGDRAARITRQEQQRQAAEYILSVSLAQK